jgi:AcrR family transcriptional regulator
MRDFIIQEIQRLAAAAGGRAPGQQLFTKETGIAPHQWRGRYWARWGDALNDAGFQPNDWNGKLDSEEVLREIARAVRHFGRLPTKDELLLRRRTDPNIPSDQAIRRHFGRRDDIVTALIKLTAEDPGYADLAAMLPAITSTAITRPSPSKAVDGFVYLIRSGDFYKIGRSDDAERRFKQITVSLPDKAELFHTIRTDDPPGIEAYWHRRFGDRRTNGEWFKLTSQDVSAFKKRKFQ